MLSGTVWLANIGSQDDRSRVARLLASHALLPLDGSLLAEAQVGNVTLLRFHLVFSIRPAAACLTEEVSPSPKPARLLGQQFLTYMTKRKSHDLYFSKIPQIF